MLLLAPTCAALCAAHAVAAADSLLCRNSSYRSRRDRMLASISGRADRPAVRR